MPDPITVQFFKYPDRPHWRHEMIRLGEDRHGVWLGAAAGSVVRRGDEAPITLPDPFVQLIPPSAHWSLIYNGEDNRYPVYVDIITPASWIDRNRVEMVDLDLDIVRTQDGAVRILDEDEFFDHQTRFGYPDWLVDRARTTTAQVALMVEARTEPFGEAPRPWLAKV